MNVAGAGIAGVIGGLKVLMLILPLLAVLIVINLGYLKAFSRIKRILSYIGVYAITLTTEVILAWTLRQDFLVFFGWLLGYMLFLVLVTFIFSGSTPKRIFVIRRIVGIVSIVLIPSIYLLTRAPEPYTNPLFESEMVKALNLKLVSKDTLYNAHDLVIVGDTVAGFYEGEYVKRWVDGGPDFISSGYFIKLLNDSNSKYFIDTRGYSNMSYSTTYSDSSIIVEGYSDGNLIRRLYRDTMEASYFAYRGAYFKPTHRLIYKNLQVLSMRGRVLIYDEVAQKLLFDKQVSSLNTLLDNCLLFVDNKGTNPTLNCLNLDRLEIVWSQPINMKLYGSSASTSGFHDLYMAGKYLILKALDAAYVLEKATGSIKWRYKWQSPSVYDNRAMMDSNQIYVSDGKFLKTYRMDSGRYNWHVKNAKLYGLYSQFVIASSIDDKWFMVIQTNSGKVVKKIRRSERVADLRLIGDYLLVKSGPSTAIYR